MQQVLTVRYGGDQHPVVVEPTTTIGTIVDTMSTKVILGYGDNVRALVHGIEQSMNAQIGHVEELVIETKANEKAS
jgi:hypothetical protein